VVRVKILFNKKDTALVQFVDGIQAQRGRHRDVLVMRLNSMNVLPCFHKISLLLHGHKFVILYSGCHYR
jgi:hypothetical protein